MNLNKFFLILFLIVNQKCFFKNIFNDKKMNFFKKNIYENKRLQKILFFSSILFGIYLYKKKSSNLILKLKNKKYYSKIRDMILSTNINEKDKISYFKEQHNFNSHEYEQIKILKKANIIIHELGHALVAKIFFNIDSEIILENKEKVDFKKDTYGMGFTKYQIEKNNYYGKFLIRMGGIASQFSFYMKKNEIKMRKDYDFEFEKNSFLPELLTDFKGDLNNLIDFYNEYRVLPEDEKNIDIDINLTKEDEEYYNNLTNLSYKFLKKWISDFCNFFAIKKELIKEEKEKEKFLDLLTKSLIKLIVFFKKNNLIEDLINKNIKNLINKETIKSEFFNKFLKEKGIIK